MSKRKDQLKFANCIKFAKSTRSGNGDCETPDETKDVEGIT